MTIVAEVKMWGRKFGAVSMADGGNIAAFEYDPVSAGSGIEISPLMMPLARKKLEYLPVSPDWRMATLEITKTKNTQNIYELRFDFGPGYRIVQ